MGNIDIELFEMLNNCERNIQALKEVVVKLINGEVGADVLLEQLYDDVLFEENYAERNDDCVTELGIIIEHLLKLRLCTTDTNHKVWINSVETHKETLSRYMKWELKKPAKKLVSYVERSIDDAYEYGIGRYKRDAKKYTDLQYRMDEIPEKMPWTLDEIMDLDIEELISDKFFKDGGENDG